jgi:hypothetical protein
VLTTSSKGIDFKKSKRHEESKILKLDDCPSGNVSRVLEDVEQGPFRGRL